MKPTFSIGKNEQGFGFLYNKFIDLDFNKNEGHLITKYLNLIKIALSISDEMWLSLTKQVPPQGIIYLNNHHISEIENILKTRGFDLSKHLVCLHLTAGWSAKRWSLENFGELIKNLIMNLGYEVAVVGNELDRSEFTKVISLIQKFIPDRDLNSRFFDLPVALNAALIKRSDLFIGGDSLPLHIAGAVGTITIGLFGPTNPGFSNPIGSQHYVLYHKLYCSAKNNQQYCSHNAGRTCKTVDCMKMISVNGVLDVMNDIIRNDNRKARHLLNN